MKLVKTLLTPPVIAISVALCAALSSFGETWTWKGPWTTQASWLDAANWEAPEGATAEYPDGEDVDVVFVFQTEKETDAVNVMVDLKGQTITVHSLTFDSAGGTNADTGRNTRRAPFIGYGTGKIRIGAGGITGTTATASRAVPLFNCDVEVLATQTWSFPCDATKSAKHNDSNVDLVLYRKFIAAEDVTLTVLCPAGISTVQNDFNASEFYGTFKFSSHFYYARKADDATTGRIFGNAKAVIAVGDPAFGPGDGYGGNMTSSKSGLNVTTYKNLTTAEDMAANCIPFNFQFDYSSTDVTAANLYLVFEHPKSEAGADYHTLGYSVQVDAPLNGTFNKVLRLCGSNIAQPRYAGLTSDGVAFYPERQKVYFNGDSSALKAVDANAYIQLNTIIAVAGHQNALGPNNAFPIKTYFSNTYPAFIGLLAADGITVNAPISRDSGNDYYMVFGAADEDSTCTFAGTIAASGYNPIRLTAPKGAKARFEGVISGTLATATDPSKNTCEKCLEIFGEGDVELAAANTFNGVPHVRKGRLLCANDKAANNKKILLGGLVPGAPIHVRVWNKANSFANMTASGNNPAGKTYFSLGAGWYTANKAGDYVLQNETLEEGDLVLQNGNPELGEKEGIYKAVVLGDGKLMLTNQLDITIQYGQKIVVDGGTWAGETLYFVRGGNVARQHILEEPANPSVAFMASADGVTLADEIDVVDNYSTGVSEIGMVASGTGTFTGNINLYRDVTFAAEKADSVTVISGTVADATDTTCGIGFSGLGQVQFPNGLDVTGRAVTVRQAAADVPADVMVKRTLATGLSGTPASITVVQTDGSAAPEGWNARVVGTKLVFKNKQAGMQILVR